MNTLLTTQEKEVVDKAVELISDPAKWTQGARARDENFGAVPPTDPKACCWCAIGAIEKCGGMSLLIRINMKFWNKYNCAIVDVNDARSREAVIEKLSSL